MKYNKFSVILAVVSLMYLSGYAKHETGIQAGTGEQL